MQLNELFETEKFKQSILDRLNEKRDEMFELNESVDPIVKKAMMAAALARKSQADRHNRRINGKVEIVNRVRNDKVQMQKKESAVKGYKIVNGVVVKMTLAEMKHRKLAAKIASRKRENEMATILRKRAISLKLRNQRLG
jgi:hypothetical protein